MFEITIVGSAIEQMGDTVKNCLVLVIYLALHKMSRPYKCAPALLSLVCVSAGFEHLRGHGDCRVAEVGHGTGLCSLRVCSPF